MRQTQPLDLLFAVLNEVGIINQLATSMLQAKLPDGFVIAQFTVLNHLIRLRDGRTPLELARAFQVPKTTMTHTLSVLEKAGLVRVAANPQDGRSKCVWLTDAGRAFREQALADMRPDLERLADRVDLGGLARILPALSDLRLVLDQMRDEP